MKHQDKQHTPKEYADILKSYIKKGKMIREFRADYNLSAQFVSGLILRFDIKHERAYTSKITKKHVRKWIEQYQTGRSVKWISDRAGVSNSAVTGYLQAYDVHKFRQMDTLPRLIIDHHAYKIASIVAANYWKDRCDKFHRYWMDEVETITQAA